jgi:putative aldouronate transport system substrate-binding protein
LAVLTGCGGLQAAEPTAQNVTAAKPLTVGFYQDSNVQDLNTNHLTLLVEEQMNVDFEFELFGDDMRSRFDMLLASGGALPDVITVGFGASTMADYISKGVFVPLDAYLADPAMSPNFHAIDEDTREFILANTALADGKVYSLFSYGSFPWNEMYFRAFINREWLDTLGLETPQTTAELAEVLRAFVERDPNGNGKRDELGLVGSKDGGYGQWPLSFMMSPFTYANQTVNYLHVKDGAVYAAYTTPEWRDGLEYMNMLVSEGLMSPLSFTQDAQQLRALASADETVVGMATAGSASNFGQADGAAYRRMSLLNPIAGPKGQRNVPKVNTMPVRRWFITKDCDDPEFAFRVGDFFLREDISTASRYGEKGVDWTDDPAVTAQYRNLQGEAAGPVRYAVELAGNLWAVPQNKHWYGGNPKNELYFCMSNGSIKQSDYDALAAAGNAPEEFYVDHLKMYPPYAPKEYISVLNYTVDEIREMSIEKTAIDLYVNEQTVAFIVGGRPLSQWEDFQAELVEMGLEKYLEAAQAAYERSMGE